MGRRFLELDIGKHEGVDISLTFVLKQSRSKKNLTTDSLSGITLGDEQHGG